MPVYDETVRTQENFETLKPIGPHNMKARLGGSARLRRNGAVDLSISSADMLSLSIFSYILCSHLPEFATHQSPAV